MKNPFYLIPVLFFLLLSCDREDPVPADFIANISFLESLSVHEEQDIAVTIYKASPCEYVNNVLKTVSGNTFNYDFILQGSENRCIAILGIEEELTVTFDPSKAGSYTLNFFINGTLFQTKTVSVTEDTSSTIEGE